MLAGIAELGIAVLGQLPAKRATRFIEHQAPEYFRPDKHFAHLRLLLNRLGRWQFSWQNRVRCVIVSYGIQSWAEDKPWRLNLGNEVGLAACFAHYEEIRDMPKRLEEIEDIAELRQVAGEMGIELIRELRLVECMPEVQERIDDLVAKAEEVFGDVGD